MRGLKRHMSARILPPGMPSPRTCVEATFDGLDRMLASPCYVAR
jgi:hypothetical protein